jgi:choline dehydrogenase
MFDFAIVGAGSAGCVLAHRLSADGKHKVVLIEAGPPKHHAFKVRAPGMYVTLWRSPLDWAFSTEPQRHVDDRRMYWPRGKVVGGTNCLNTLVYMRGHRDNYDEWRDLGNPGWGYADVLPYFKRSEDNVRGASEYHGAGGLLPVNEQTMSKISTAFCEATAARCKVKVTDDFNAAEQEGAGAYQVNVRGGLRRSTATEFLDPARDRANLTLITDAVVTGVVVDGDRVTGVRARVGGSEQVIEAREVILAGGAIGSPHVLMLSGIGRGDELRAAGVEPRHELPGVGKHLEDHLLCYLVHDVPPESGAKKLTRPAFAAWALRHLIGKAGPLASSPVEAGAFVRQHAGSPRPDNQFHFVPWGLQPPNTDKFRGLPLGRLASILPGLIYPKSSGEIRLRSADPADAPMIDPNYLSDPADLEHLVGGVKLAREIAATAPLAALFGDERWPGPGVTTDDELRAFVRSNVNTIFHPTGTCKMGTDPQTVVDPALRVHGLRGLRVADASIMPRIIGGNTNAPTIMIAEKAADLVLGAG